MKLEDMSINDLTRMGKTHYLILSLLESAEKVMKDYPFDVSKDARAINMQALESIAKVIEERRGDQDRDAFLKEISSIFDGKNKKRKSKAKAAVNNSQA
jgi:hypothetical protein